MEDLPDGWYFKYIGSGWQAWEVKVKGCRPGRSTLCKTKADAATQARHIIASRSVRLADEPDWCQLTIDSLL